MSDESLREQLIQTAIELIKEDKKNITIRNITERADVSIGLINYHFQTKENLMNIAAQRIIDNVIAQVPALAQSFTGTPCEKLRLIIKATINYLQASPHISRLSILQDMKEGNPKDNTQMTIRAYDKILKDIIPDEHRRTLAGHILCASLQSVFLRADVLQQTNGFDFSSSEQREKFVDELVDIVIKGI